MARHLMDNETLFGTPAASKSILFNDSTTKKLGQVDDSGNVHGILSASFPSSGTASQTTLATETYITNSGIQIPSFGLQVGQMFRWYLNLFRATSTGTVAPIYKIYVGLLQSTGDTLLLTLTGVAPVSATAGGVVLVEALVRTIGASAIITGNFNAPGVNLGIGQVASTVSGSFNTASVGSAGQYMGLSVTPGTNTTYTIDGVRGELIA